MLTMLSTGSHDLCGTRIEGLDQVCRSTGHGFPGKAGPLAEALPVLLKERAVVAAA